MHDLLMLALMLIGAHWLCDYPLQGQFLSDAKVKGPMRFYHLVAHSGIQGAAVALVTGNVWLGLAEWAAHTAIDEAKVRGKTTFAFDQVLHIGCKLLWLLIVVMLSAVNASAKVEPARPDMKAMLVEDLIVASESGDVPCLRSHDESAGVLTWSIRAKDGTILSAGAIYVRQRC